MKPPGKYDELRPRDPRLQIRQARNGSIRRYRGRIAYFAPEYLVALGLLLLVLGASLLFTHRFSGLSEEGMHVMAQVAASMMFLGWALIVYVFETARLRSLYQPDSALFTDPAFFGVYLPAPIHQEWLSAQLLPEVVRGWVAGETLPGYEPYQGEFVQPPIGPAAITHHEEPQPPLPQKKRNRKKKNSSTLDDQSGESSMASNTPDDLNLTSSQSDDSGMACNLPENSNVTLSIPGEFSMVLNMLDILNEAVNQQYDSRVAIIQPEDPNVAINQPEDPNVAIIQPEDPNVAIIQPEYSNVINQLESSNLIFNKPEDLNLTSNHPESQKRVKLPYISKSKKKKIRNKMKKIRAMAANQPNDLDQTSGQAEDLDQTSKQARDLDQTSKQAGDLDHTSKQARDLDQTSKQAGDLDHTSKQVEDLDQTSEQASGSIRDSYFPEDSDFAFNQSEEQEKVPLTFIPKSKRKKIVKK